MVTYGDFAASGLDLSPLGLIQNREYPEHFCTPKGAEILGEAGVDGIHFCFVPGHGETVFAVSPMNLPGEYVHPVARNFSDFLALLAACGDTAAIEQAWQWDQEAFSRFLRENPPSPEQREALGRLRERLGVLPMEEPFAYLRALQKEFDHTGVSLEPDSPEDAQAEPARQEWKVFFGGFFGGRGQGRAGKEKRMEKEFLWGEERWYLPAVYFCAKGLVAEFCVQIEPEKIRAFLDQWEDLLRGEKELSTAQQRRMELENPLELSFSPSLICNGKPLPPSHGCGLSWIPESCLPQGMENSPEAMELVAHYGLDEKKGWMFRRSSFPWATGKKPEIRSLILSLERIPGLIPGPCFPTPAVGESLTFCHPVTGGEHLLKVLDVENPLGFPGIVSRTPVWNILPFIPCSPIPGAGSAGGKVSAGGQRPQRPPRERPVKEPGGRAHFYPESHAAVAVGIIGGADGPTAVFFSPSGPAQPHTACSGLRFAPVEEVTWQMYFREKSCPGLEISLL